MITNSFDFKNDLISHNVYTAWQFVENTQKNIAITEYCADTINRIVNEMTATSNHWEELLFANPTIEETTDGRILRRYSITTNNSPNFETSVAGEKTSPWFLFDKLLRDFFQYAMNSFDSISQVANAGLLANRGKKVDTVDFQRMAGCFAQQTYKTAFPKTSAWFDTVYSSSEFKYIEAINNRTKHTADIANKLSIGIMGTSNTSQIGSFFRKDTQHEKRELSDQLRATLDYLNQAWADFLTVFCDEFILDTFTENRRHQISGVYQQKIKNEPKQDFSYAFIEVEDDFSSMPDELHILFVVNTDELLVRNCPFTNILVRNTDKEQTLGRYVAADTIGDDCLLHYRKYVKDTNTSGSVCEYYERQRDVVFYHNNPFFEITCVSDDDTFIGRCYLPF